VTSIEAFFAELDASWRDPPARVSLHVVGSTALKLQTPYLRATNDSDVLETAALAPEICARLRQLAGHGSAIHTRRKLYLDIVANGLPFLPQVPLWRPAPGLSHLVHFEVVVLDVVDVAVSKLKRFIARDVADIDAMVDLDVVPHDVFVERFRLAVEYFSYDARADDLPRYVANFHQIERDSYGVVVETTIELPSWIGNG
jgi:hypothetical protein